MIAKRIYPPKIEKLLRERELLDKSIDEKRKSHERAMQLRDKKLTHDERLRLIEAYND